jgi:hypothetical protein
MARLSFAPRETFDHEKKDYMKFSPFRLGKRFEGFLRPNPRRPREILNQAPVGPRAASAASFGGHETSVKPLALAALTLIFLSTFLGCGGSRKSPRADLASLELGRASAIVVSEKLKSPDPFIFSWSKSFLGQDYRLENVFNGPIGELLLALSGAIDYSLVFKDVSLSKLTVSLRAGGGDEALLSLINELNRQLRPQGGGVDIDVLNRKLILTDAEERP